MSAADAAPTAAGDGFEADWLALRAAADGRARDAALAALGREGAGLADVVELAAAGQGVPLEIVDLGAGTGNDLAYLAPRLARAGAPRQRWTLVDADPALLERAVSVAAAAGVEARPLALDLARDLARVPLGPRTLLCMSALLDLASEAWLEALAGRAAAARVPALLLALTVDGEVAWTPADAQDYAASAAFHADMRRDKGLGGRALAGAAPAHARAALERAGYTVHAADSTWRLGPDDAALQRRYLADVARVVRASDPRGMDAWQARRAAHLDAGQSELAVGHVDLVARRVHD